MPQIADTPVLSWSATQKSRVVLSPITLPAGRTLADFDAFTLTIREDPKFPRTGAAVSDNINPLGDGWAVSVTSSGAVVGSTLVFDFASPSAPGYRRYSMDVRATGGTAGPVSLLRSTWLTVLPLTT